MSLTDLLDQLITLGPRLSGAVSGDGESAASDAGNEINAALLPVWQWLDNLKPAADENNVDWVLLDGAPSEETIAGVKAAIEGLAESAEYPDLAGHDNVQTEIAHLGRSLRTLVEETDDRLATAGVEAERRARLLLPLLAHVSELAVSRGSSKALSLARETLGQVGEKRLSEGIAKKANYEQTRADWFRVAAVLSFAFSIGWLVASYLAFDSGGDLSDSEQMTRVISRLAIGSAVFALAVYFSRESSGHRGRASAWQSVQLQMDSLELYCASLPDALKDAIRLSFGLEVFSGSRLFSSLGSADDKTDDEGQLAGIDLSQAASLVNATSKLANRGHPA